MIIKSCSVTNFGSYPELEFNFDQQGLTLISGPTGSGKSTLCDIIPWVCFGRTAKDGNADEIRSWGITEETKGAILVDDITITRIRGKVNDLFITMSNGDEVRGSDLKDTQRIINEHLHCDASLYLSAAYLNEFSQTTAFFIANAKVRRTIIEQLVDLSFSTSIATKTTAYSKDLKTELVQLDNLLSTTRYDIANNEEMVEALSTRQVQWESQFKTRLAKAQLNQKDFEKIRQKELDELTLSYNKTVMQLDSDMEELKTSVRSDEFFRSARESLANQLTRLGSAKCSECGASKNSDQRLIITKEINKLDNEELATKQAKIQITRLLAQRNQEEKKFDKASVKVKEQQNTWDYQIAALKKEENPYTPLIQGHQESLLTLRESVTIKQQDRNVLAEEISDCEQLIDVINNFRELLTKNTILSLQDTTNDYLSDYFDGEIKVMFETDSKDKIEVTVFKDGNACVYSQLSKGQRQLLRLCFGVAVMKHIKNHHALSFSSIFFDEIFSGLDSTMINKGFQMLKSLQTDFGSIYVVEHNEDAKVLADNKLEVSLINGRSEIAQT